MKILLLSLAVLCIVACSVQAQRNRFNPGFPPRSTGPTFPKPPRQPSYRFRREPQGSVTVEGRQPLSGPDRHPSIDINYNHPIINNDRTKLDTFGGANLRDGRFTPQAGFGLEHRFKNDIFVRGQGQVQPGPRGGLSPSFGAEVGWRFRRDLSEELEEATEV